MSRPLAIGFTLAAALLPAVTAAQSSVSRGAPPGPSAPIRSAYPAHHHHGSRPYGPGGNGNGYEYGFGNVQPAVVIDPANYLATPLPRQSQHANRSSSTASQGQDVFETHSSAGR